MAHCPYCLSPVSKTDFVCATCGAERGYLYFNRRSRGLLFLLAAGLLGPLAFVLAVLVYFQGMGMPFWLAAAVAMGLMIFTIQRLVTGPTWYR
ncbi:hypothetical protein CXZ10_11105 [Pleomorphomonas diazotrophica]|uniref:Uncharacterized protein n=1 Tax=Pleomorphomonas diazotrophica TaxID=1166257 RepID=A0A1I4UGB3_9HYPH|nr:hypothetical protein [Pleomorphomonas diazotrophica]PKR89221.1 hypothetical protein CXZ10_11105 [Pleomorphomonas diazotrophica]SFM87830.1 hypothetical protein SAMN05192571_1088 [Pleomorphomonas diazotrophica]